MKEYYILLLNNTYSKGKYYMSMGECTMFPNIIEKEWDSLNNLNKYFHMLDDTIIETEEGYKVYGSFPVIGELIDGKMYDAITKREIKEDYNDLGKYSLSYHQKEMADTESVEYLLSLLDKSAVKRYAKNIDRVASYHKNFTTEEKYSLIRPQTGIVDAPSIIAKDINGELVDIITEKRIYILPHNAISSHIYRDYKNDITKEEAQWYSLSILESGIDSYLRNVKLALQSAIIKYNTYKEENTRCKTKVR